MTVANDVDTNTHQSVVRTFYIMPFLMVGRSHRSFAKVFNTKLLRLEIVGCLGMATAMVTAVSAICCSIIYSTSFPPFEALN